MHKDISSVLHWGKTLGCTCIQKIVLPTKKYIFGDIVDPLKVYVYKVAILVTKTEPRLSSKKTGCIPLVVLVAFNQYINVPQVLNENLTGLSVRDWFCCIYSFCKLHYMKQIIYVRLHPKSYLRHHQVLMETDTQSAFQFLLICPTF